MSGTVGVIADVAGRYSMFAQCLTNLHRPVNTPIRWRFGSDRAVSRTRLVEESLDRGSEWILFLDDDTAFRSDLLMVLLAANQPVVGGLYVQRGAPFLPVAYAEKDENGYLPLDLRNHSENELIKVRGLGTGGMLIRSEVFREIGTPWFIHTTEQSEDLYFCDRLDEHEIPLYVHTGARLGHIAPAVVWPAWDEGHWVAGLTFSESAAVLIEMDYSLLTSE